MNFIDLSTMLSNRVTSIIMIFSRFKVGSSSEPKLPEKFTLPVNDRYLFYGHK